MKIRYLFLAILLTGCAVGPGESPTEQFINTGARVIGNTVEQTIRAPGQIVGGLVAPVVDPAVESANDYKQARKQRKAERLDARQKQALEHERLQYQRDYCVVNSCEQWCIQFLQSYGFNPDCSVKPQSTPALIYSGPQTPSVRTPVEQPEIQPAEKAEEQDTETSEPVAVEPRCIAWRSTDGCIEYYEVSPKRNKYQDDK